MRYSTTFFLIILTIVLSSFIITSAQTLYFCEGVEKGGKPITPSSSFTIASNGGYLYTLVQLGYEIGKDEVYYEIYRVDSKGKEIYDNTIYQEVDPKSLYFHKQISFFEPGKYNIYIYTGDGVYLTSGSIKINRKWFKRSSRHYKSWK